MHPQQLRHAYPQCGAATDRRTPEAHRTVHQCRQLARHRQLSKQLDAFFKARDANMAGRHLHRTQGCHTTPAPPGGRPDRRDCAQSPPGRGWPSGPDGESGRPHRNIQPHAVYTSRGVVHGLRHRHRRGRGLLGNLCGRTGALAGTAGQRFPQPGVRSPPPGWPAVLRSHRSAPHRSSGFRSRGPPRGRQGQGVTVC